MKAMSVRSLALLALVAAVPGCVIYSRDGPRDPEEIEGLHIRVGEPRWSRSPITRINERKSVGPFSDAVGAGEFLFLSGEIPRDPETGEVVRGDIARATRQVFQNISKTLHSQGLGLDDVVMVTVYLKSMDDYQAMNEAYAALFARGRAPARATVQVARLALDADMEIAAVAYRGRR
jgi:2-iminobutanoate/2-iminopropanoate deaminase